MNEQTKATLHVVIDECCTVNERRLDFLRQDLLVCSFEILKYLAMLRTLITNALHCLNVKILQYVINIRRYIVL